MVGALRTAETPFKSPHVCKPLSLWSVCHLCVVSLMTRCTTALVVGGTCRPTELLQFALAGERIQAELTVGRVYTEELTTEQRLVSRQDGGPLPTGP